VAKATTHWAHMGTKHTELIDAFDRNALLGQRIPPCRLARAWLAFRAAGEDCCSAGTTWLMPVPVPNVILIDHESARHAAPLRLLAAKTPLLRYTASVDCGCPATSRSIAHCHARVILRTVTCNRRRRGMPKPLTQGGVLKQPIIRLET